MEEPIQVTQIQDPDSAGASGRLWLVVLSLCGIVLFGVGVGSFGDPLLSSAFLRLLLSPLRPKEFSALYLVFVLLSVLWYLAPLIGAMTDRVCRDARGSALQIGAAALAASGGWLILVVKRLSSLEVALTLAFIIIAMIAGAIASALLLYQSAPWAVRWFGSVWLLLSIGGGLAGIGFHREISAFIPALLFAVMAALAFWSIRMKPILVQRPPAVEVPGIITGSAALCAYLLLRIGWALAYWIALPKNLTFTRERMVIIVILTTGVTALLSPWLTSRTGGQKVVVGVSLLGLVIGLIGYTSAGILGVRAASAVVNTVVMIAVLNAAMKVAPGRRRGLMYGVWLAVYHLSSLLNTKALILLRSFGHSPAGPIIAALVITIAGVIIVVRTPSWAFGVAGEDKSCSLTQGR